MLQLNADGAMYENEAMHELREQEGGAVKSTGVCAK